MVNAPNWLTLDLALADGKWWSQGGLTFRRERRELDLRRAVLRRSVLLEDDGGRQLEVVQRRVVSMAVPHLAALETVLIARGWSGPISVRSGVDADVANTNVPEYSGPGQPPFGSADVSTGPPTASSAWRPAPAQSHVRIATALRTTAAAAAPACPLGGLERAAGAPVRGGADGRDPAAVSKIVAVVTSRDRAVSSPRSGALAVLAGRRGRSRTSSPATKQPGDGSGSSSRSSLDGGPQTQLILNLHVFHLLQTITGTPPNSMRGCRRAACTARGTAATSSGTSSLSCRW